MSTGSKRRLVAGTLALFVLLVLAGLWQVTSGPSFTGMSGTVDLDSGVVAEWEIYRTEGLRPGTMVYYQYEAGRRHGGGQRYLPEDVNTRREVRKWMTEVVKEAAQRPPPGP